MYREARVRGAWSARSSPSCGESLAAAERGRRAARAHHPRSRARLRQGGRRTASSCWRACRELGGPGSAAAGRAVAQVVPDGGAVGDVPPGARDWGTAAAVTAAVLRRARTSCACTPCGEMAQVVRVADASGRGPSAESGGSRPPVPTNELMAWARNIVARFGWRDAGRHPHRRGRHLRAPQADPRHPRRPDGPRARLLVWRCSTCRSWAQLSTVNWLIRNMVGLRRVRAHRAVPVRHPPRARAFRPGALLPVPRRGPTAPTRSSRSWRWPRRCSSAQRIGAIIAVEREIGLRNYIEAGIPLDATLTYDLLVSDLPAGLAAARRRRHRPGGPRRGGRLLPAADGEPARQQGLRHAASRGHRPHRGDRRGRRSSCPRRRAASRWRSTGRSSAA